MRMLWGLCLAFVLAGAALAQPRPAPDFAATTLAGAPVTLQSLRGKVVLVLVWSTRCPVCLDKMPELRRNLAGWRGRDFVVLALSQDAAEADLRAYAQALAASGSTSPQLLLAWRRAPGHRDNLGDVSPQMPATFVIDRQGRLLREARGRWDPELWNEIAEVVLQ